ncbi:MAG: hypothetical protein DHS20C21_14660 [Gemmatimonadota bacterium]|nr:MAG: hypothetical protein DHS20C21_14660 [Gemmatimonadota bacterium]
MSAIGFEGTMAGISVLNASTLVLATGPANRVWVITGSGGGQALFTGAVRSSDSPGCPIPSEDAAGRSFPVDLSGKTVRFTVAPGFSFRSMHGVSLTVRSLEGTQPVLYDWEGRIRLSTTVVGGFEVIGTAERYGTRWHHNLDLSFTIGATEVEAFDYLMTGDPNDTAGLRRAAERVRSGRSVHAVHR